jgi:sugar/nucleoside kinase (ribokinase family)
MLENGIAVIGSTTIDKIVKKKHCIFKMGGVTTYAGITYRRHNLAVRVVSNLADQDTALVEKLNQEQIMVDYGETKNTTRFVNYVEGNDHRQRLTAKAAPIKESQIAAALEFADSIHLGPLHPNDIEAGAIKILEDPRLPVFLDVQGYTRQVEDEIVSTGVSPEISEALRISQVVKANEPELQSMLDFYRMSLEDVITRFEIEEFVVTLGKKGGYVKDSRGDEIHYPAEAVQNFDDSTGAGDVFFAAYIVGRFLNKSPIPQACAYAAKLSAQQISGNFISRVFLEL